MATTDGERLHAGTLRKVIGWHEAKAAAAASKYHRERKRNGSSTADVEVAVHERAAQAFEMFLALATEADSQPPRLSGWVAACEGTGLGEPTWLPCDDDLERFIADFAIGVQVELRLDADNSGVQPTVFGEYAGYTCLAPAELRSALERLAQEAK